MKAQTKALIASVIVIALGLSAVSGVTYSWFSDSEQSDISVTTGAFDVRQNIGTPITNGGVEQSRASLIDGRIVVTCFVPGMNVSSNIKVEYKSTIDVVYRTFVVVDTVGFTEADKEHLTVNGVKLSSGSSFALKSWTEGGPKADYTEIINENLKIVADSGLTGSTERSFSITIITEMYQGNYLTSNVTTEFTGETMLSSGIVSGTTSSDGADPLPITVDFTGAIGVSNGMTFKAASKFSSGTFSVSNGSSTKAIIDLTLMDEGGSVSFGGEVKVTVKVSGDVTTGTSGPLSVIYNGTTGEQPTLVSATYDSETDKTTIVFTTTHFSDFVIYTGIPVDSQGIYCIYNADQLFELNKDVNERNNGYNGQVVKLMADIDLEGKPWTPLGRTGGSDGHPFYGTFEGNNKTIYGLNVQGPSNDSKDGASGFFGWLDGKVKNLTISGAKIEGNHYAGGIAGYIQDSGEDARIEGCKVIDSEITSAFADSDRSGDKVGGIVGFIQGASKVIGNTVENVTVTGCRDVGAIAGCAESGSIFTGNKVGGKNVIVLTPTLIMIEKKNMCNIGDFVGRCLDGFSVQSSNVEIPGASVEKICEITDIMQLEYVLDLLGKGTDPSLNGVTIKLMNDLSASSGWVPGTIEKNNGISENIIIDGRGHAITGLTEPLFGNVAGLEKEGTSDLPSSQLTIKNLFLKDGELVDSTNYGPGYGAFVCTADDMKKLTISGCGLINYTITGSADVRVGGFVGYTCNSLTTTDSPVIIEGSKVESSMITVEQGSVGGLIGHAGAGSSSKVIEMTNCTVKDCVLSTVDSSWRVGSMVGTMQAEPLKIDSPTVNNCTLTQKNSDNLEMSSPYDQSYVGRVVNEDNPPSIISS